MFQVTSVDGENATNLHILTKKILIYLKVLFYKVLFKPGFPVQARELTTLQSLLQGQIESFGSHIFKEGSVVVPGNISYDNQFYAVKLNATSAGIDVALYIENFVGKKIIGQESGITAKIQHVEFAVLRFQLLNMTNPF